MDEWPEVIGISVCITVVIYFLVFLFWLVYNYCKKRNKKSREEVKMLRNLTIEQMNNLLEIVLKERIKDEFLNPVYV